MRTLASAGVVGVSVDIWWGIVEREPGIYDWTGFLALLRLIKAEGLKVQAIMSWHACGGNVGDDDVNIPLPPWILSCSSDDMWYQDQWGALNKECISLWADHMPCLPGGRTPLDAYASFAAAFARTFRDDLVRKRHVVLPRRCTG
jgi:beta-amylase